MGDERLGLLVDAGAPPPPADPGADHAPPVAPRDLGQAGHADRPGVVALDDEVHLLTGLALDGQAFEVGHRVLLGAVRTPREEARHLGVRGEAKQGGRVGDPRQPERERGTGDREARHASAMLCGAHAGSALRRAR